MRPGSRAEPLPGPLLRFREHAWVEAIFFNPESLPELLDHVLDYRLARELSLLP